MILGRQAILDAMQAGDIVIEPFNPAAVGPNSVNLRLDRKLLVYDCRPHVQRHPDSSTLELLNDEHVQRWTADRRIGHNQNQLRGQQGVPLKPLSHIELANWHDVLDMKADNATYELTIPDEGLVLVPGRLYLGKTVEWTETKSYVPMIEGRSSTGRLGLDCHISAGFGDNQFKGCWTLELRVVEPLRVYPHVHIAQIYYHQMVGASGGYVGKYQQAEDVQSSRLWQELGQQGHEGP